MMLELNIHELKFKYTYYLYIIFNTKLLLGVFIDYYFDMFRPQGRPRTEAGICRSNV